VTRRLVALVLAALLLVPPVVLGQSPPPAVGAAAAAADSGFEGAWPREMSVNGAAVLIYQPQIDKWDGNQFEARAAVAVRPPGAPQPSFGVIWLTARTDVDKERGLVTLHDIMCSRAFRQARRAGSGSCRRRRRTPSSREGCSGIAGKFESGRLRPAETLSLLPSRSMTGEGSR
jgi:hypothetical protein